MMTEKIKILFIADSHLGFDLPHRPRIERRRRGEDLFENYLQIMKFANREKVDLILHGGDLFHHPGISPAVIERAYRPLYELACTGIPVFLVPGNHERSRLPGHLYLSHENIRVFDRPATYTLVVKGKRISFSGFPFTRKVRENFPTLLGQTGYQDQEADWRFLCAHQTFEGARVGPVDFTFREGPDNIPPQWVPGCFGAVLSGHIHRAQELEQTLEGSPLKVPVIYPGSIERTSIAERFEDKSFRLINVFEDQGEMVQEVETHPLPARPMLKVTIPVEDEPPDQVLAHIRGRLSLLSPDAVVRIELTGQRAEQIQRSITAASLRAAAPGSMNISFRLNLEMAGNH
jgi:DNA repair exonuclease SbcCD nuclease subunit